MPEVEVEIEGFESDGIDLISPLNPEFDSRVEALSPDGFADVVKDAKPYVVIVSNRTHRKIVALTMALSNFEGTAMPNPLFFISPSSAVTNQIFIAPDGVDSAGLDFGRRSERGIPAGGLRLIGLGFTVPAVRPRFEPPPDEPEWDDDRMWNWVVSTTADFVARIKNQGAGTRGIRIKLDAVVFDDGQLIGPDTKDTLRHELEGFLKARQELYRKLVDDLDRGHSVDEAFAPLKREPDFGRFDDHFDMEAISTADALRKRYGDERIRQVLQQAIFKQPFVVHRN